MKKAVTFAAAAVMLISGCASTTVLKSTPSGASVYMNGEKVGTTPYTYTDTKIVGSSTTLVLKKRGYEDFTTMLSRSEQANTGAIVGGVFALVPLLWCMDYKPEHNYELQSLSKTAENP